MLVVYQMVQVVALKWGEALPCRGDHLVVTHISRTRGSDFYIEGSPSLAAKIGGPAPADGPGFALLQTTLAAAEVIAKRLGVPTIYVQPASAIRRVAPATNWPA
jgi:hypothetical protein